MRENSHSPAPCPQCPPTRCTTVTRNNSFPKQYGTVVFLLRTPQLLMYQTLRNTPTDFETPGGIYTASHPRPLESSARRLWKPHVCKRMCPQCGRNCVSTTTVKITNVRKTYNIAGLRPYQYLTVYRTHRHCCARVTAIMQNTC